MVFDQKERRLLHLYVIYGNHILVALCQLCLLLLLNECSNSLRGAGVFPRSSVSHECWRFKTDERDPQNAAVIHHPELRRSTPTPC